ncbi:MAG: glycosyltransferase [Candidatus Colwellbacteria bacterium]|nr:glycosyltransferase [Candidatus Colwellbacteria bacterium]
MSSATAENKPVKHASLALVMMVKNENKRIVVSLDSVKGIVDKFVIMDTGSEDNTVEIIKTYCDKNKIELHLLEKSFPPPFHYSNARNVVLDFADDKAEFLLLLDCNDELKDGPNIRRFVDSYEGRSTAFHICQEWWNGISLDKYYNIRLLKAKNGWRYKGAIHEYISNPICDNDVNKIKTDEMVSRVFGFTLYQDRTMDDDKSFKRFARDEEVLEAEYQDNIKLVKDGKILKQDSRTVFYYGQTCMCLGKNEKAYRLYRERSELEGFTEERYHAYYRCGEISRVLKHNWEESFMWYHKAYEYSAKMFDVPRAEPLYRISEYYREKCIEISYMNLKRCCELKYPESAILFVDRRIYDYLRWNLMSLVGFDAKEMNIGKYSCCKAITAEKKSEDIKILEKYIPDKKERDVLVDSLKNGVDPSNTIVSPSPQPQTRPENNKQKLQKKMENMKKIRQGK